MTPPFLKFFTWLFPLLLVVPVTGLMCFSCQSSQPFSECESNIRELRKGSLSKYAVNCSAYNNLRYNYCAIESYIQNGKVNAMIRDCNDGIFSFSEDNYPYIKMKQLNWNSNITVCTYSRGRVACASLCDSDMCNGPTSAADISSLSNWIILSLFVLELFF